VRQEQTAVEIRDLAGEGLGGRAPIRLGLGEGFEEQGLQELAEKAVGAALLALGQLGAQVVGALPPSRKTSSAGTRRTSAG
jgi:hypothetical protein